MNSVPLYVGQVLQSHLFGPIRITAILPLDGQRVVHCRSVDGHTALILSRRYCARLPVLGHV